MTHKEPVKKTARPGSTPGHRSSKAATRTASAGKDRVSDPSAKAIPSRRKTQSVRMKRMRRKKSAIPFFCFFCWSSCVEQGDLESTC